MSFFWQQNEHKFVYSLDRSGRGEMYEETKV